ncbi:3-methyladenine DNA glycosylase [Candidatus Wolfebacteria bacterium RIFCSPLOWO2_01_FULL_38_11]|uniref:Putative 3-methyladenine DNA glycosylase n=2 Tax=Candidatus Wolfeibacteriota TaxID=1752735 RepID=A0A0G0IGG5_9BACT|nr:MAG: DNA-3-methyladenine glycosylase, DNA-3-methyladenine glycosylase [Candidatus Wolfebacteria bacterium GW2011_GWC1_37_10]OGM91382.1 MAG: 3-methyladenine DNA glycosylase [Candidatus Wolfebacteria bacterium RIFCSPLOWO2_01_FULL_38_11]
MNKILSQKFFNRSTLIVAQELLGTFLVRKYKNKKIELIITEVEAYDGFNDLASHASRGKTERNKIMFEESGKWYVYFTYGMHYMLNMVTGPKNYPAAILIRGTREIKGPARLTKFLKINRKFNGKLANKKTGLWIEDRGIKIKKSQIIKGKRIGVDYTGKWANKPYRFYVKENKY